MTTRTPAWMGLTVSHLYAGCPGRLSGLSKLRQLGWDRLCGDKVDPLGTDICGWCSRVWRAHQRAGVADEAEQRTDYLERLNNCTHDEVPPLPGATCGTCGADLAGAA